MTSPREEALLDNAMELLSDLVDEFEQSTGSSINNQVGQDVEEYLAECLNSKEPPDKDTLLRIMKKYIQE